MLSTSMNDIINDYALNSYNYVGRMCAYEIFNSPSSVYVRPLTEGKVCRLLRPGIVEYYEGDSFMVIFCILILGYNYTGRLLDN